MSKSIALSAQLPGLQEKMRSIDPDYRIMALVDLDKELTKLLAAPSSSRRQDPHFTDDYTETQLVDGVLQLLADTNGEVKSAAVECISLIVKKPRASSLTKIITSLLDDVSSADDERRDTSCLALKNVVLQMPADTDRVAKDVERIVTRVFRLFNDEIHPQIASELLQILTDLFNRFSSITTSSTTIQSASISSLTEILSAARPAIRKRAIPTLSALITTTPALFNITLEGEILKGVSQGGENARVWMGVAASLARGQSASSIGRLISQGNLAESILSQASNPEDTETVEAALTALEALVPRCPTEISPFVSGITQRALELVKYDPNYVDFGDDDDVDMLSDDEADDEDGEYGDADYSDDDDDSWKIRKASAKLLLALIITRPDLLSDFYSAGAPVLIARFSEREESVRLEVLAAFEALLKQTASVRSAAEIASAGRNKRKRSEGVMDEDYASDDGPIISLRQSLPHLVKGILAQLSSKSVPTRQQSFTLLRQVVTALSGGLDDSADPICTAAASALKTVDSATSSSLPIATLSFLTAFFLNESAIVYSSHLGELVPTIVRCMKDKLQRISFEAFDAASALVTSVRPSGSTSGDIANDLAESIQKIFAATVGVLGDTSINGDVREKALSTLGNILVHAGDLLGSSSTTFLPLITNRLGVESTALTAISVIGQMAASPLCKGPEFDVWFLEVLPQVVVALRRTKRGISRNTEFTTLSSILDRFGKSLPVDVAEGLITELSPLIDTTTGLHTTALVLTYQPAARSAVESQVYDRILSSIKVSTNPHLVDSFFAFFVAYAGTLGQADLAVDLVQQLVSNLESEKRDSLPDATNGGTAAWGTTAKCVGGVVRGETQAALDVLSIFENIVEVKKAKETDTYLALLSIGEIGRIVDLSSKKDLFETVLTFFKYGSEEVRSAAAFAAGNIAVGCPHTFLPAIVSSIESTKDESERLLLLHAIKEVIFHSSISQLESFAESLWGPLFASTAASASRAAVTGDDGIRNVTAACIGKLTITSPGKFLPLLQDLLRGSPSSRAIVAAAVRYTFIDTSSGYDELIAPIIVEFLSLMRDENLIVRRLSLASLNASIQNKPHLIIDKLGTLQPLLYQETYVKKELQREVSMGPWKVIEDDGLENRKTAYETMYTLLGTCFSRIDLPTFTARVLASLSDVNEVKILGLMLLLRLGQISPGAVIPRLDEVVDCLKVMMKDVEVRDDTVKQDLERKAEMQRSTLRTVVPLYRSSTAQKAPAFHAFVESLLLGDKWKEFKDYQG